MINIRSYTEQKLLHFIFEVQEGRMPDQMLLDFAADALRRSLKKEKPDVLPPVAKGRPNGEQRNLDREIRIVWLRQIKRLTQEDVCDRLNISDPKIVRRAERYFKKSTLSDVRKYNKILSDYRFRKKEGLPEQKDVIPCGEYYKVMSVFGELRIVDYEGEKKVQKYIWDKIAGSNQEAMEILNQHIKKDSK